ncbi:MAG: DUF3592 domain-containing protein [Kiritimatiellae bacterium]|nr:DUF3592 domain-containing protein [Kiritimatiellia bacterium]MCO5044524.1 DUF3592 domain-containing protein [Kiritimatiellia bacterium]MCO5061565.1 DUF3592 domain-containing protein [Kiritimatiellia bacterium]MCO5067350.1 DUF3592 domain-containing protein [Kiritimatiellia bacterium]
MSAVRLRGANSLVSSLFAVILIVAGVFAVRFAIGVEKQSAAMQGWTPVLAHIRAVDLERVVKKKGARFRVVARYEYEVDGQSYEGSRVSVVTSPDAAGGRNERQFYLLKSAMEQGGGFKVFVNPANPMESVLFPEVRRSDVFGPTLIGAIFVVVGVILFLVGVISFIRGKPERRLAREYPDEPWRWRADWSEGVIKAGNRTTANTLLVFSLIWCAMPAALLVVTRDRAPLGAMVMSSVFLLVGILFLVWAIRELRIAKKYGAALFHMASVPGVMGGSLAGVVSLPASVQPYESYRTELVCQRRVRRGKHTSTDTLWRATRLLDASKLPSRVDGLEVPILFAIPIGHPASGGNVSWILRVKAKQPGVDLDVHFAVPVFQTAESSESFVLDESGIQPFVRQE